ncbi:MAG: ACT domain-containing protein [Clostridia bacterium]|nr:ACT domain-containing protein [Clostridia bacterium]
MKVSCLGPKESYSSLAADKLCKGAEKLYCSSFAATLNLLTEGAADAAVLPVENCIMGSVVQNLDLISTTENVMGVGEYLLPIEHRLVTKGNVPYSDIQRVCSHVQALSQCSEFITNNFPDAKLVYTHSTAESLSMLDEHTAGIVGAHVKERMGTDGFVFSEENIADAKENFTRFLLFKRGSTPPEHSEYVYFSAVCKREKVGELCSLLEIFTRHSINVTRVESRPVRDIFGNYRFFIEFEGDIGSDNVKRALKEAEETAEAYKLLGAYGEI